MHPDAYPALDTARSAEIRVKGSRFLAFAHPAENETEARALLREIESRYPDASHHCWALRLGHPDRALCRDSDAGEPGGSAGPPIARALKSAQLSDLICVVVRWFGGTKLGVGGLIRAYGEAARESLTNAPARERLTRTKLRGSFAYEHEPMLRALLERLAGRLIRSDYDERVHWIVALPPSDIPQFERAAADLLRDRSVFEFCEDESVGDA